ncbi:hypothetical protein P3X46_003752 [Hevea brasiliensis]|uniref:DUF4378 domain-containing protein n=1 Tax=Hevea brasiliensis TaxID=3981 RepID=A0ABQ9N792_HEVBR|nr:uncharacterized protein LOC110651729 [Hevea brasiliensis]KAJ9188392.1 hypothetical protein P3X46_003752 [Hevea brasiliensis]
MGSPNSNFNWLTKHFPLEHRPRMLKDFLTDDSNSCSSTSFKSFPKKPSDSRIRTLIQNDLNDSKLLTCRSRAASTTISAFQAMINAVKNIHLTAIKSPSILPRSLSRRPSRSTRSTCREIKTENENKQTQIKITVTIKDIMQWKSFRDLEEEKSPPFDLSSSSHHCTTATTPCSSCSSNGSSWCDSDFTSEYGNFEENDDNEVEVGKKYLRRVGEEEHSMEPTKRYTAVGLKDGKQHNSPFSVIDIEFEEDEESSSFFDQSFATETNTSYEEEEEAWQLLKHVKETSSVGECRNNLDRLLLDFFRDELKIKGYQSRNDKFGFEILSRVKAWIDGEQSLWIGWDKKEAYVREMEREGKWIKFEEEQEEVALAIENWMLDELLLDLFS